MAKVFFMGVVGGELKSGIKLIGAHIDAPRLDLKQQPIYEEEGMALLRLTIMVVLRSISGLLCHCVLKELFIGRMVPSWS